MLEDYIKSNNCFKLILGANNENFEEITKLVALYSAAGCEFFDINPTLEAVFAAKKGLNHSKKNGYICISVGTKDDVHFSKCKINQSFCKNCHKCLEVCIQNAIYIENNSAKIDEKKCIGCKKCLNICKNNALEQYQKEFDFEKTINEIKNHADCIEFHIITNNQEEIFEKWKYLCLNFPKYLSIALNRSIFSDKDIKEILFRMFEIRKGKVMIQADGAPMSGGCNDFNTTLQAVSTADIIRKTGINPPIIISGGTNSKSRELAKLCNVDIQGVAIGSYARKMVREYINKKDFLENKEEFSKALKVAKEIIYSNKKEL